MTKKFNLSRTLARPKSPEDILRTMNLMKAIREAGAGEPSATVQHAAGNTEAPKPAAPAERQP